MLIQRLPEVYQPIYGHTELSSSRMADGPRIDAILCAVDLLEAELDRKLRILDLGSAQGYLAFLLAARGHHVTGVESLPDNVTLAEFIATEHPQLDVAFVEGDVTDIEALIDLPTYDLVLGMSVLHHVAHRDGHDAAKALVARIARYVPNGVFEMALAREPLYWAASLPADPRMTLASYAFIRELARSSTHLSEHQRPVLFCSQKFALVRGELRPIESWSNKSHAQNVPQQLAMSRYYFVPGAVAKVLARFDEMAHDDYLSKSSEETRREAHLLPVLAATQFGAPELLEFVQGTDETVLVRTLYRGHALNRIVGILGSEDRHKITTQLLERLADLERHGLYHGDLRLWNVIYDRQTTTAELIDFGSVFGKPWDVSWPHDAFYSFVVFCCALWSGQDDQTGLQVPRSLGLDSAALPARVVDLICFVLCHPNTDRVFADALDRWTSSRVGSSDEIWPEVPLVWNWLGRLEEQRAVATATADQRSHEGERLRAELDDERRARLALQSELDAVVAARSALESSTARQAEELHAAHTRLASLDGQLQAELVHEGNLQEALDDARLQLDLIRHTVSWRLTRPLRALRRAGRRDG